MPGMNDRKQDWFHMTPTDLFIDLMETCEESGWSWEKFIEEVESTFMKQNPKKNKGKTPKVDSVRQKCDDVNNKLVKAECPPIKMPYPDSTRVNWKERALRRKQKIQNK